MPNASFVWLAWDGSQSPNGELNKHNNSQSRDPMQGKGPRFLHKIGLSLGRGTYTLVHDRSVAVKIEDLDADFDPMVEVLRIKLKLKQEHLIRSLLLRILDHNDVVVYQEALDAAQLANLDHGDPNPTDVNWRATQQGHSTYVQCPFLDHANPFKVVVWVSQAEHAFQIRSEGRARLLELTRQPPIEYGYQVSTEYDPTDDELGKRYRRKIRQGGTTLVALKNKRDTLVRVRSFNVRPPVKLRVAILNPNTSFDSSLRKRLVYDIAQKYGATQNDPITWAPYAVPNRYNALQLAPHAPHGTVVSCPHYLDPDSNFDSWKWRVRYLLDKITEIDNNVALAGDGPDVLRVMLAPEWFFSGTQSVSRFLPGLPGGTDSATLQNWAENIAPVGGLARDVFNPPAAVIRPYTEQEKDDTIQALTLASANHPRWLIIPGTILWKKPKAVGFNALAPQWVVFNTAVVYHNGNAIHTVHKQQHGGDANMQAYGAHGAYHGLAWSGRLDPAGEWAQWVGGTLRNTIYGPSSVFQVPGFSGRFGLDICADHGMFRCLRQCHGQFPLEAGVSVHFITSAGKNAPDQFSAARAGGFAVHCDSSGFQHRSGIKRIVSRARRFQDRALEVANWFAATYDAKCTTVPNANLAEVNDYGAMGAVAVLDPAWDGNGIAPAEHGTDVTPLGETVPIHLFDRLVIPGQTY